MTQPRSANYLQEVREQYESYPYPPRNPEDEKKHLKYSHNCLLDIINHYHYSAIRDFSKDFRVLIAGGGTGDALITMAEQLKGTSCEIVYVDISTASMRVAQERAKMRQLDNITWVHGSLLDVATLTQGQFDYIDCSGVLHHLAKPEDGLRALAGVLKDDGLLGIMVYARYGREMLYRMQHLMRMLNAGEEDMQQCVENCKTVLRGLPAHSGFAQELAAFNYEIQQCGDSGIYDMFLHSHDVAYTVPELHAFAASAGLNISHLFFNRDPRGNDLYRPESYVTDARMLSLLAAMDEAGKQAVAEILHGRMIKHTFYAVKSGTTPVIPSIENLALVPYFGISLGDDPGTYQTLYNMFASNNVGDTMAVTVWGSEMRFVRTKHARHFFQYIDGKRTLAEIFAAVRADHNAEKNRPSVEALHEEFKAIYQSFNRLDWMLLKPPGLPVHRSIARIVMDTRALYAA